MFKWIILVIAILFIIGTIDSQDSTKNCQKTTVFSQYNYPYKAGCIVGNRFLKEK